MYDHPILYEVKLDGTKKKMGSRASRKVGILSMFGIGQSKPDGKKLTMVQYLHGLGGMGIFLGIAICAMLIGRMIAILP